MPQQISTTPEQSRRLLACGVSADTADMCWHGAIVPRGGSLTSMPEPSEEWDLWADSYDSMPEEMQKAKLFEDYYEIQPAWSLSALLGLLPKEIYDEDGNGFYFSLAQEYPANEDYKAAYKPCWFDGDAFIEKRSPSPFEACVQLVECLAVNGYKLNKPQKDRPSWKRYLRSCAESEKKSSK